MGRLIDEDDVLNVLCHELCHPGVRCPDGYCEEMREKLKDVPTADAVTVIRCKDCARCSIEVDDDYWCDGRKVWKDHYCSYGKRRKG